MASLAGMLIKILFQLGYSGFEQLLFRSILIGIIYFVCIILEFPYSL